MIEQMKKQIEALLLNEFLKEHRKVEEQAVTIAGLQKVSAQIESSQPAARVVSDN